MAPVYEWKYLVCGSGAPAWDEFEECHAVFGTMPMSNRDFDCTRVAEAIGEAVGWPDAAVTLCMEDPHGNRHEVDMSRAMVAQYTSSGYRDLGKAPPR